MGALRISALRSLVFCEKAKKRIIFILSYRLKIVERGSTPVMKSLPAIPPGLDQPGKSIVSFGRCRGRSPLRLSVRGISSVGRAIGSQSIGQGFESPILHRFLVRASPINHHLQIPCCFITCEGPRRAESNPSPSILSPACSASRCSSSPRRLRFFPERYPFAVHLWF